MVDLPNGYSAVTTPGLAPYHGHHGTEVVMDSAQNSQAAGQIMSLPMAAPSPLT